MLSPGCGSRVVLNYAKPLLPTFDIDLDVAVVNYDFPDSAIAYVHRIGRTGRAGRKGAAVTFFTEDDVGQLRRIANVIASAGMTTLACF